MTPRPINWKCGHEQIDANIYVEGPKGNRSPYQRCLLCKREQNRNNRSTHQRTNEKRRERARKKKALEGPPVNHTPGTWAEQALCATLPNQVKAYWYSTTPSGTDTTRSRHAIAYCQACPVIEQCLTFALDTNEQFGIWGGTTPNQRTRMRKQEAS